MLRERLCDGGEDKRNAVRLPAIIALLLVLGGCIHTSLVTHPLAEAASFSKFNSEEYAHETDIAFLSGRSDFEDIARAAGTHSAAFIQSIVEHREVVEIGSASPQGTFTCYITTEEDSRRAKEGDMTVQSIPLSSLELGEYTDEACLELKDKWWTYKVCLGNNVTQYHADVTGKVIDDPTDDLPAIFNLGQFATYEVVDPHDVAESLYVRNAFAKYSGLAKEVFTDGTPCDSEGVQRTTTVFYGCDDQYRERRKGLAMKDAVSLVVEVSTCSYLVVVHLAGMCATTSETFPATIAASTLCIPATERHLLEATEMMTSPAANSGAQQGRNLDGKHSLSGMPREPVRLSEEDGRGKYHGIPPEENHDLLTRVSYIERELRDAVYVGHYQCSSESIISLEVQSTRFDAAHEGILVNFLVNFRTGSIFGAFQGIGIVDVDTLRYIFFGSRWIDQPDGFHMISFFGRFAPPFSHTFGTIPRCKFSEFQLFRVEREHVHHPRQLEVYRFLSSLFSADSARQPVAQTTFFSDLPNHELIDQARFQLKIKEFVSAPTSSSALQLKLTRHPTYRQIAQGLFFQRTFVATGVTGGSHLAPHRERSLLCLRGYCLQFCRSPEPPFSLDCLVEMWMLVGCHPSSLLSPFRAPPRQHKWWQKLSAHGVFGDMTTMAVHSNKGNSPYNSYCPHPSTLSRAQKITHLKDLHNKFDTNVYREAQFLTVNHNVPIELGTHRSYVLVGNSAHRYLENAHIFFRQLSPQNTVSAVESLSLKEIARFKEAKNLDAGARVFLDRVNRKLESILRHSVNTPVRTMAGYDDVPDGQQ